MTGSASLQSRVQFAGGRTHSHHSTWGCSSTSRRHLPFPKGWGELCHSARVQLPRPRSVRVRGLTRLWWNAAYTASASDRSGLVWNVPLEVRYAHDDYSSR
jgi:hypothetical protein